jgi:hypothetical protein
MAACSSAQNGPKVSASVPSISTPSATPTKAKIDITVYKSGNLDPFAITKTKELAGFDQHALEWGMEHIYAANEISQRNNIEGVALFGNYCVVLFSHVHQLEDGTEEFNILVVSRRNKLLSHVSREVILPDGVIDALNVTKNACWTGDYYPQAGNKAAVSV